MNKSILQLTFVTFLLFTYGCTWVKPLPGTEDVLVLQDDKVSQCQSLGRTTVSLKAKVLGIKRNRQTVRFELETLAKNSAFKLKGNTIVVDSNIENGQRSYRVYLCP